MEKNLKRFGILVMLISWSCAGDFEFQRSVFVEDEEYPGLPKYSELGYNTFGAYYGREPFTSGRSTPVNILVTPEGTAIILSGVMDYSTEMDITFNVGNFFPEKYADLMQMNGQVLDLTDENYTVVMRDEFGEHPINVLSGTFTFSRIQNLLVDDEQIEIVLSGTFEVQGLLDGRPITLSNGRFDLGVGPVNFYID